MDTYSQKTTHKPQFGFYGESVDFDKHRIRIVITAENTRSETGRLFTALKGYWDFSKEMKMTVHDLQDELESVIRRVFYATHSRRFSVYRTGYSLEVFDSLHRGEKMLTIAETGV